MHMCFFKYKAQGSISIRMYINDIDICFFNCNGFIISFKYKYVKCTTMCVIVTVRKMTKTLFLHLTPSHVRTFIIRTL